MSGSGAAGGFNFQAISGAYIISHLIASENLRWSTWQDQPFSIAFEQGGAGDDIRVEFADGKAYEIQVKRGLRADRILEEAVEHMSKLLNPNERGILLVDPTSSNTVTRDLQTWLDDKRRGLNSELSTALLNRCSSLVSQENALAVKQMYVVELDLEQRASSHRRLAQEIIKPLIQSKSSPDAVLDSLTMFCHHLMSTSRRCDADSIREHLMVSGHILSPPSGNSRAQMVNIPMRLPSLIGRDEFLLNIQSWYTSKVGNHGQVIKGISGAGKSSVAIEFCYRVSNYYDNIVWIDAADLKHVRDTITSIKKENISTTNKIHVPLLLVLDDIGEFDDGGEDVINALSKLESWHILATSTNDTWSSHFRALELPQLTQADALTLLTGELPRTDLESVEFIVDWVVRLPLALAQLSTYAAKTLEPFSVIRQQLLQSRVKIFSSKPASLRTYKDTVGTCWHLVLNKLDLQSATLLRIISFLGSTEIPLDFLSYWFENVDPDIAPIQVVSIPEATAALSEWLILKRSENGIECHKLIQEVVRDSLNEGEKEAISLTIAMFFSSFLGQNANAFQPYMRLKRHILAFLDSPQILLPEHSIAQLNFTLGTYAWRDDPLESLRLIERAENLSRKAGAVAVEFLATVLNMKGVIYKSILEFDHASDAFGEALKIAREDLKEPEAISSILDNSAQIFQSEGENRKALDTYVEALNIRKDNQTHPDGIVTSLSNVVGILIEMGKTDDAETYLLELIELIDSRLQGDDHSINLTAVCMNTAGFCESLKEVDYAVQYSLIGLALGRKIYGHGTNRYLEDALASIAIWLRLSQIEVVEWFVERSLSVLPESIRPVFWFNCASLCIAYSFPANGINHYQSFSSEYGDSDNELLQSVAKTARMLAEDNERTPDDPSMSFIVPPNVKIDVPQAYSSASALAFVEWDTEFSARTAP